MSTIIDKAKNFIKKHQLISPEDKILAACSGGCDSFALTHILATIQEEFNFQLFVANINHMLRPESYEEALIVEKFCANLNIPYYHKAIDIKAFMKSSNKSLQEAARYKRYEYLNELAINLNINKIATGHHLDDQVETIILNILRGTGSSGLNGIKPISHNIIRPVLNLTRNETEEYCKENKITWCEDSSNFKTDYLRNKVRLELIPLLEDSYNPNIKENICRISEIVTAESNFIDESTLKYFDKLTDEKNSDIYLDIKQFKKLHLALQRNLIRKIIEKNIGSLTGISFNYVESLINMALNSQIGSVFVIPNLLNVEKTYEKLIFYKDISKKTNRKNLNKSDDIFIEINVPGVTLFPELSLEIHTITYPKENKPKADSFKPDFEATFDLDSVNLPLLVRTRKIGDRFKPLNMSGSKKLKDFFIDEKIPQKDRNSLPLVCDQDDILWIVGHRLSDKGKITSQTKNIIQIKIKVIK
ncbi:tRNA lysidine(34) synthetase TilS [Selenomonadales bacterium OttesenSCG-928-I06]|nr:tRNA lysidine(34) synthetase TilS [Selenomonadales bacterium OttesenSCG-928-I06]